MKKATATVIVMCMVFTCLVIQNPMTIQNVKAATPSLTITSITESRGTITVHYTTTDADGDSLATSNWEYSHDGNIWKEIDVTAIGNNNAKVPGASWITWDTTIGVNNLGGMEDSSVWFRMKVEDSKPYMDFQKQYNSPGPFPSDLTWAASHIWSTDPFADKIYIHNMDATLSIALEFNSPGDHPHGLAADGTFLWSTDIELNKIYQHNPDASLSVRASYNSPGNYPSTITWDGTRIWSGDKTANKIYKHNMDASLSVAASYNSPNIGLHGLTWDGSNIWSCDSASDKIYKHNMNAILSVSSVYNSPGAKPHGLTWDGNHIWSADIDTNKIYKHSNSNSISSYSTSSPFLIDNKPPSIIDNQDGDDTWRNSNDGIFDVDFSDDVSKLDELSVRKSGDNWYLLEDLNAVANYNNDWSLPASVWSDLQEGNTTIDVRAKDEAGNEKISSNVFYIKKDTVAPSIIDNQNGDNTWRKTNNGTYDVDFSDSTSKLDKLSVNISGGNWHLLEDLNAVANYNNDWSLPASVWSDLEEGQTNINIWAKDEAGNENISNSVFYVKKDTEKPTSFINSSAPYWKNNQPIVINATAKDNTSGVHNMTLWYRFSSDNNSWDDWLFFELDNSAPWTFNFTAFKGSGYYEFYSITNDTAGNKELTPSHNDTICGYDPDSPNSSVNDLVTYWQKSIPIIINVTANDNVSEVRDVALWYRYSNDNNTWDGWICVGINHTAPLGWSFSPNNGSGYYQFYAIANDIAGNIESTPITADTILGLDMVPPALVIDNTPTFGTTGDPFTFFTNFTDNHTRVEQVLVYWSYDKINYEYGLMANTNGNMWEYNITLNESIIEMYYYFIANDSLDNSFNNTLTSKLITISDNDKPILFNCRNSTAYTGDELTFYINISDNIDVANVFFNFIIGNNSHNCTVVNRSGCEHSITITTPLNYTSFTYFFWVNDTSGNWNKTPIGTIIVLDNDKPFFNSEETVGIPETGDPFTIMINASDNIGITFMAVIYTFDGTNYINSNMSLNEAGFFNKTISVSFNATYLNYSFIIGDEAGNYLLTSTNNLSVVDNDNPLANAGEDIVIDQGYEVAFNGDLSKDNIGIGSYMWTFVYNGIEHTLYGMEVNFIFNIPGNYTLTLTVKDAMGNSGTDTVYITVIPKEVGDDDTTGDDDATGDDDTTGDDDAIGDDDITGNDTTGDDNDDSIEKILGFDRSYFIIALIFILVLLIVIWLIVMKRKKSVEKVIKQSKLQEKEEPLTSVAIYLLGKAVTCNICFGIIKPGLPVVTCGCGKHYHLVCIKRVNECPNCGLKVNRKNLIKDLGKIRKQETYQSDSRKSKPKIVRALDSELLGPGKIIILPEKRQCKICFSPIKQNLKAIKCSCSKIYHVNCGISVAECPYCSCDFSWLEDKIDKEDFIKSSIPRPPHNPQSQKRPYKKQKEDFITPKRSFIRSGIPEEKEIILELKPIEEEMMKDLKELEEELNELEIGEIKEIMPKTPKSVEIVGVSSEDKERVMNEKEKKGDEVRDEFDENENENEHEHDSYDPLDEEDLPLLLPCDEL